MKDKCRDPQKTEFSGRLAERIDIFLDHVTDKDQRVQVTVPGFVHGMLQNLADLGLSGKAEHRRHEPQQLLFIVGPGADPELAETAIKGQLDIEPAEGGRFNEHLPLNPGSRVPCRLTAGRRVHCKHQPATLAGVLCPLRGDSHLGQKGINIPGLSFLVRQIVGHTSSFLIVPYEISKINRFARVKRTLELLSRGRIVHAPARQAVSGRRRWKTPRRGPPCASG